jgi:hypothetical protein
VLEPARASAVEGLTIRPQRWSVPAGASWTPINAPDLVMPKRTYGTRSGEVCILSPSPAMTLVGTSALVFM